MRLLPERPDHDRQGAARQESASDRRADPRGHGAHAVPLHDVLPRPGRRSSASAQEDRMITVTPRFPQDLRDARSSASAPRRVDRPSSALAAAGRAGARGPYPDPDFHQLDSWIVIHEDNTATFYVGKTDCGQGTGTAFRQMMSDELDIAYDKTDLRHGQHRHHRRSGRLRRIGRDPDRRLADAPRRRRSAARAARDGVGAVRRAGRSARGQRRA